MAESTEEREIPESRQSRSGSRELGSLEGPLRPLVDLVARVNTGVHAKLLVGLLLGAMLLVAMGVLSLTVIDRMNQRVTEWSRLQEKVELARKSEYAVTAQSHFRAMALLTGDDANNQKIADAKKGFLSHLTALEDMSTPSQVELLSNTRDANERFAAGSEAVLRLYKEGKDEEALALHLAEEHPISHELEGGMRKLVLESSEEMAAAEAAFQSDRRFLSSMVGTFSGVSLALALLVGVVLSLAFTRPLRRIEGVVAAVAGGDFTRRVQVPNRDELGALSRHVNRMTEKLASLYEDLRLELADRKRAEDDLERRAVEMVAVNNELEAFKYSVSHDFLEPLNNIDSSCRSLAEDFGSELDTAGQQRLESVQAAGRRIRDMVSGAPRHAA